MNEVEAILLIKSKCLKTKDITGRYIVGDCPMAYRSWTTCKIGGDCSKCPVYLIKTNSNTCPVWSGWTDDHESVLTKLLLKDTNYGLEEDTNIIGDLM